MDNFENVGEVFFWVPVSVLALAVLGLLWAPFAALICILVARFRKLGGESYGAVGAKHSMLLVLPWVYLLVRMLFGKSLPVFVVVPVYGLVYSVWLVFYIAVFNVGGLVGSIIDVFVIHSQPVVNVVLFFIVLGAMLPANLYTWRSSARALRHRYAADKGRSHQPALTVSDREYAAPFIWLIVWSLVVFLLTIVAGLLAYSGM